MKRVLVIAGSDSSGGAGLEADQKVLAAHGCYAMTACTALTVQNTHGVQDVHITPSTFVAKQIKACVDDIGVDVIKIGMLASAGTIEVVASALRQLKPLPPCVVDPVMVSTSGARLLPRDAVRSLREVILSHTFILTPNLDEAQLLLDDAGLHIPVANDIDYLKQLAGAVQRLGPRYVLLKGGHMSLEKASASSSSSDPLKQFVANILVYPDGRTEAFETKYINSGHTHGTGCSLASAIASNLSYDMSVSRAVEAAIHYVAAGIDLAPKLGSGCGPINHFHSSFKLPFSPGLFIDYLLRRHDVSHVWSQHVNHGFVDKLAKGILAPEAFRYYLIQDYLFLIHFARASALAAYKAQTMQGFSTSAMKLMHLQTEVRLHIDYCKKFGMTLEDLNNSEESQACTAYTRYILDIGNSSDGLMLQMAFMPCLLGYGEIADRLSHDPATKHHGNPYYTWIETYIADDYVEAMQEGRAMIERYAILQSPSRIEEMVKIFVRATKLEIGFWEMGSGKM